MPDLANNTIDVLNFLVPGFVAAGVYYGLTVAPKSNTFERVIQALIFTVVIEDPKWLGDGAPVPAGEALAVQADDVEMVEFVSLLPASSSPKDAEDA